VRRIDRLFEAKILNGKLIEQRDEIIFVCKHRCEIPFVDGT